MPSGPPPSAGGPIPARCTRWPCRRTTTAASEHSIHRYSASCTLDWGSTVGPLVTSQAGTWQVVWPRLGLQRIGTGRAESAARTPEGASDPLIGRTNPRRVARGSTNQERSSGGSEGCRHRPASRRPAPPNLIPATSGRYPLLASERPDRPLSPRPTGSCSVGPPTAQWPCTRADAAGNGFRRVPTAITLFPWRARPPKAAAIMSGMSWTCVQVRTPGADRPALRWDSVSRCSRASITSRS